MNDICPICRINEVTTATTVDFKSDTAIPCCQSCQTLMTKAGRIQYFGRGAPKGWWQENRQKLDNAWNRLYEEYDRVEGIEG